MLETYKNSRGRISSRVLYYTYDLKDQLLTANKEGEIRLPLDQPVRLCDRLDQGWTKSSHQLAIIFMGQERQVQTQQAIPLPITVKSATILGLTIQDRATSMKVALFF